MRRKGISSIRTLEYQGLDWLCRRFGVWRQGRGLNIDQGTHPVHYAVLDDACCCPPPPPLKWPIPPLKWHICYDAPHASSQMSQVLWS